uniref:Glutathione peroxidase 2 n=1 Tax=Homo sapiens TaxID=9606 RepID=UPI0000DB4FBD|nr:Chain A, Glutathione peroxidase 2 [Homo sapiens]
MHHHHHHSSGVDLGTENLYFQSMIAKSFYDLSAINLDGEKVDFNTFRGRAVLIENVASLCGTTTRDFTQLNELQCRFPRRLVVLGFPCNQFGHQENCQNEEILNSLKYVRPGGGYQPTFTLVQKCEVNGQNEHPVFAYLKDKLPYPYDDPFSLMTDPKLIIWSPVRRSDVAWNFEKFLIGPEGEPFRRYSRTFPTINIEPDIKRLLKV